MKLPPASTGMLRDPQRHTYQLSRLVETSLALNSTLDVVALLQNIIHVAADVLNCETASLLLYEEVTGQLRFAAASGSDPEALAAIPVPLEGSLAGQVYRQNQALVVNDLSNDPRHFTKISEETQFHARRLVAVPMSIRDSVIGVLEGMNKHDGDFNNDDVYMLSVIASQAAVAIQNASLVQQLRSALEELTKQDQIKSDFMALASHELRTPLGVVLGHAALLKQDLQGELAQRVKAVETNALRMRAVVEDLSNMPLLHLGADDLHLEPAPIQNVVEAACFQALEAAQAKGQRLHTELGKHNIYVQADRAKLEQAFNNLLDNAVRFTPKGGAIRVACAGNGEQVRVTVKDNGIGIPPDKLETIFDQFTQAEDHMTRTHGGLGLGLAIAKSVVEAHRGRIWAESAGENQGATFTVIIPITTA